jgi:serine/threonine protein kinase
MPNLINQTIDNRYRITGLLGQGNMGAVYQAQDLRLARPVALKVLRADLAERPAFREQFVREARTLAQLEHPGIVRVHDAAAADQLLYLIMDYLPGQNLLQWLEALSAQQPGLDLAEALEWVRQLCLALEYAHRKNIVHGDIKPANIMLLPAAGGGRPYRPVLTDFGLARLVAQPQHPSGTPAYASPEQAAGEPLSPQSDLYSLGVLLYELAVGRRPFEFERLSAAALDQRPPLTSPRTLRPDLPASLEAIILKALAIAPGQRFASAAELAQALQQAIPAVKGLSLQPLHSKSGDTDPDETGTASDQPVGAETDTSPDEAAAQPVLPSPASPRELAELQVLSPNRLMVDPGGRVTIEVQIINLSYRTHHYRLQVAGIPELWLPDLPPPLRLFREGLDGSSGQTSLTIAPPRHPQSKAGDYEILISAVSENNEVRSERQLVTLTVNPYYEFSTELWPDVYRAGQTAQLLIQNQGNTPQTYTVRGYDSADEVKFTPSERSVEVEPGKEATANFKIAPRQLNLIGRPQDYPFRLQTTPVEPEEQPPQESRGTVRSRRLIPAWALLFLLALLCIPLTAIFFFYSQQEAMAVINTVTTPTATTIPTPTATPLARLELSASKTAIEAGECIELSWIAEGLEYIYLNGELVQAPGLEAGSLAQTAPFTITGQGTPTDPYRAKPPCPTQTTSYTLSGQRAITDTQPVVINQTITVQQLATETVTFLAFPDGQPICPNCQLDDKKDKDAFKDWGVSFGVATDKVPANCQAKKPVVAILASSWQNRFLTTIFTQPNSGTQPNKPLMCPTPPANCQTNCPTPMSGLPSCRQPTPTPTPSPLQQCTFAPFRITFIRPTRSVTITFAFQAPAESSIQITDPVDPGTAAAAAAADQLTKTYTVPLGRIIKDIVFGLDGRPVAITKIEYVYLLR